MAKYDHIEIENKYKTLWFSNNLYKAVDFDKRPKKYILAELPYPSGKFLHIGHMMRYTVPEIYTRFLRMSGFNVLFPMGWDCFGLPAETFAQKEGITPQEAIAQATIDYKKSMMDMGYGIDWDREINTSKPEYYKWTQMMFLVLFKRGLAVQREMPVWWCKELGVLADEEVLTASDGKSKVSERGSYPVERKQFKQWVLDIPKYAERLIKDLDKVDYEDSVKQGQINWIGKQEGAHISFDIQFEDTSDEDLEFDSLQVFTTRPDTIFGVTYLAISPEHKLISQIIDRISNKKEVLEYIEKAKNLSDMEKQTKEKTGIILKGITAKNPLDENSNDIPVFVADYILSDYGTGVVMGVPAHDNRDFEFATKYNLKVIEVIEKPNDFEGFYTGTGKIINSGQFNGLDSADFAKKVVTLLEDQNKGKKFVYYKLRPQVFSRQRYWGEPIPLIYKQDGSIEQVPFENLPIELPIMKDFLAGDDGISPLEKNNEWKTTKDSNGNTAIRETDTMPTWAGSNWYYMRYIDPKNDKEFADFEKLKYWMPIDMYFGDAGHTTAHLLYTRFWNKVLFDEGLVPFDEPVMYRMSGGMLLGSDGRKMSKSRGNVVNPKDELDKHGADAVRTYLAFIGPYEDTYPWNPNSLIACTKLVTSIYNLSQVVDSEYTDTLETNKRLNKYLKNMTEMLSTLKMNTAVSEIMIFVNYLKKQEKISKTTWKSFLLSISPFMPFLSEYLWQTVNNFSQWSNENSVHLQNWPSYDENLIVDEEISIPVQINGKVRLQMIVRNDFDEETVLQNLKKLPKFEELIKGREIKKFIYIKNKIANIVVDKEEN